METLTASDAKREFGGMLIKVQREPVRINKNGKPVAVVLSASEYVHLEQFREEWLKTEIQKGMKSVKEGHLLDGKKVMAELKKHVSSADL